MNGSSIQHKPSLMGWMAFITFVMVQTVESPGPAAVTPGGRSVLLPPTLVTT